MRVYDAMHKEAKARIREEMRESKAAREEARRAVERARGLETQLGELRQRWEGALRLLGAIPGEDRKV